jgi:signal transduction histidine kinase
MGKPIHVLLVEDSPDDAELVKIALRRAGCEADIHRVTTASEYHAALDHDLWDVILSDFSMPGFSGQAALEMLRARGIDLPFIIVSGTVGEEVAVRVMKAGAHDFFPKGNLTRLASAIEREVREACRRRDEIAERRRTAAELQALLGDLRCAVQVRDDFLSIASHELKTPLTSLQLEVQGLQRLLARQTSATNSDVMAPRIDVIARQVSRLTMLVNTILDVTRFASGRISLARESVDLKEVIEQVLALSEVFIRRSGSEVLVDCQSVSGPWDRLRIESLVTNLVLNAVKYGKGRLIEIKVDSNEARACLVVRDHGMGISSADQTRIFEKFERAVPPAHYGGLGLGLWIARQTVVAHGGDIRCESVPGAGSTFTVELPLFQQAGAVS